MGGQRARGVTLDAGALIGFERRVRSIVLLITSVPEVHVPAGALAQVWRDPRRQIELARLLDAEGVEVHPLDHDAANAAGVLCGATGTSDIIDASVVLLAQTVGCPVITSDPEDLRRLAPHLPIVAI